MKILRGVKVSFSLFTYNFSLTNWCRFYDDSTLILFEKMNKKMRHCRKESNAKRFRQAAAVIGDKNF
jgi:hypothetical protein